MTLEHAFGFLEVILGLSLKTVKTERYQSAESCSDSGLKGHMTLYTRIKLISDVWTPVCEHSDNTVNRFLRSSPSSGLQEENRLYKSCE